MTLTVLILIAGTVGCNSAARPAQHELLMAPMADMAPEVQKAPVTVQQAYQFAFANADVLKQIPCYCGCGQFGHKSNYDCYVAGQDAAGNLTYDKHALTCAICVDITQDTIRLVREGQPPAGIRTYVDTNYARYGLSNMPPAH